MPAGVQDEFHRPGVDVARPGRQAAGALAHAAAQLGPDRHGRGLLDHLLVAALDRALALAQVDHVAVPVGHDLDLDVPGDRDVLLHEHPVVAEGLARLLAAELHRGRKLAFGGHDAHALAAAARGRLEQDRVADFPGGGLRFLQIGDRRDRPGHDRHPGLHGQRLGGHLVAQGGDGRRRRPDEDQPGLADHFGELRVFGEKAVAGVNGGAAGLPRRVDDLLLAEVGLVRAGGPDRDRLVRRQHVLGARVGLRVDGHGADPQAPAGADDPDGDLAAVGYQDFVEHGRLTVGCFHVCGWAARPACFPETAGCGSGAGGWCAGR